MSYLITTRLFSGLLRSIENREWAPIGMPAFYKLLEALSEKKIQTDVIFFCKSKVESKCFSKITNVKLSELNINFVVVPYYASKIKSTTLSTIVNDTIQLIYFFYRLLRNKYKLVYTDKINLNLAIVSSLLQIPTVVRFFGIANLKNYHKSIKNILLSPTIYLGLKKKYDLVICTEDGSPSEYLFKKHLSKKTPYAIVLNGIDKYNRSQQFSIREKYNFKKNIPILLFVGRLTRDKGIYELIETIKRLKNFPHPFYLILICGGSDTCLLKKNIDDNLLTDNIRIEKFVSHEIIHEYYRQCDIYISLNQYANLSNTVLEAIQECKCIVMLDEDKFDHTDKITKELVPDDIVIRIDRFNIIEDLYSKLTHIISSPEIIEEYSNKMRQFAETFLWSWDERIDYELKLLDMVTKKQNDLFDKINYSAKSRSRSKAIT